jgi:hypothetical protein
MSAAIKHECTPRAAFNRVTGFAGIVVGGVLGLCVAASTVYDVSHWVAGW